MKDATTRRQLVRDRPALRARRRRPRRRRAVPSDTGRAGYGFGNMPGDLNDRAYWLTLLC